MNYATITRDIHERMFGRGGTALLKNQQARNGP